MRHPAEFFIKFLITYGTSQALEDSWVRKQVKALGYKEPEDEYLEEIRADLDLPPTFSPNDLTDPEVKTALTRLHVFDLHQPELLHVKQAYQILGNRRVRETIETLALGGFVPPEIAELVEDKHDLTLTEGGVAAYLFYFWNVDLLSLDEWEQYLGRNSNKFGSLSLGREFAMWSIGKDKTYEDVGVMDTMVSHLLNRLEQTRSLPISDKSITMATKITSSLNKILKDRPSVLRTSKSKRAIETREKEVVGLIGAAEDE